MKLYKVTTRRMPKERRDDKWQTMYFVEYWVEGDDTSAETGN